MLFYDERYSQTCRVNTANFQLHLPDTFKVIIKGAVSRQSSSFCLILPSQLLALNRYGI